MRHPGDRKNGAKILSRELPRNLTVLILVLVSTIFCGKERPPSRSDRIEAQLERLKSVPYTSVTPEKVSEDTMDVTFMDRDRTWPGYNFYCSRTSPEALLLDMDGNVVHTWSYEHEKYSVWDYAILLGNGDIIVLNKFQYVFQLDWNSNLLWEKRLAAHHDVVKVEDGTLFVIELSGRRYRGLSVRFTSILHLDPQGNELGRWSSYEHLDELKEVLDTTPFLDTTLDLMEADSDSKETGDSVITPDAVYGGGPGLRGRAGRGKRNPIYDYFHINTITILPETPLGVKDPRFAPGSLLICLRNVNQIATINWETGEVLWGWGEGVLERPHHPTVLPDGNILIFDNGTVRGFSKVLEIEPASGTIVWQYAGDPPESFFSPSKGSSQRLPNGNTLICEGDRGRVFEVTTNGETVWEWYNPLLRDGRRAQVYRMIRHPAGMIEPLIGP